MKRKTNQIKDYCEAKKQTLIKTHWKHLKKKIVGELSSYSKSSNYWNLPVQAPGLVITSHNYP